MFIDLVLLLLFIIIAGLGFFQGTIKLVIAIVTFYASIVLSSLYFKFLASYMARRGTNTFVADAISFFLILVIAFAILLSLSLYTFRYVRFPGKLEFVDRILGVLFGVVLGVVLTSILSMVLQYVFISHSAGDAYPISRALQGSVRSSVLLPLLIYNILPQLFAVVSPFLPDAAIPFFNPAG